MNDRLNEFNERQDHQRNRKRDKRRALRQAKQKAKEKIKDEGRCRNPNCITGRPPQWHHIVHRSFFGREDIDQHHEDNAMPLCSDCHTGYHAGTLTFTFSMLSDEEAMFVLEKRGVDWLEKVYPKDG